MRSFWEVCATPLLGKIGACSIIVRRRGLEKGKLLEGEWAARLDVSPMAASQMIARRSFEPQCGPARDVASVDSMFVRTTDGSKLC